MKFQLLLKAKMLKNNVFLAVKLLVGVFIMIINEKMPKIYNLGGIHAQMSLA